MIYPVGSIYMSVNSTSPADLFGGTWEQIKDTFLLSAGDNYAAGSSGGEATHTLTVDEMPKHKHYHNSYQEGYPSNYAGNGSYRTAVTGYTGTREETSNTSNTDTNYSGSSQPHNNMPPYLAVYCWKRVS